MSPSPPDFNSLTEAEQRAVAERLLKIEQSGWKPFWCKIPDCDGMPHTQPDGTPDPRWAHNHARSDQRLPAWQKAWVLAVLSGRGSGKTTLGVEFTTLNARRGVDMALIGRRGTELINTHVRTILDRAHPEFVPEYQASKDILVWPNGAITYLFSAERPENIRSINVGAYWIDEAAFMDEIETVWMNLRLATRIEKPGNPLHGLITSTPTPTPWMMKIEDDPLIEVRRVSTYANRANLSPDFIEILEREYEGTRMGRQELHGEVLRDVEGAMWTEAMLRHKRIEDTLWATFIAAQDDRVVAVDPAGSKGPRSDATGIIGVGSQFTDDGGAVLNVLADGTIKGTPNEWAAQTFRVARAINANRIVVERNFGGDMVIQTLRDYAAANPEITCTAEGDAFRVVESRAVTGKETRAEPLVGRYEQGRVFHCPSSTVFGDLSELEKEMLNWVPKSRGGRSPSPNRVDALVWACRDLERQTKFAATTANQRDVMALLKRR